MNIIEVKNLKKSFGALKAVDDINLTVEKGEIFGFLGPNGAGKTTTIRCLMNFIYPTSGEIKIFSKDAQKDSAQIKRQIGYLSGNVRLCNTWTGAEHIKFIENIRGKSAVVKDLIKKLDFNPNIKSRHLSSGNKQKLGLILALMSDPELLIMDEPTVGLDLLLQNTIYKILEELKSKGKTIFMSSHNLAEVERLCGRVGIIREGKLVAQESIKNLHDKRLHHVKVQFDGKFQKSDFSSNDVQIEEVLPNGLVLKVAKNINPLIKKLSNYNIIELEITHATLEEIFLEFYQRSND